MTFVKVAHVTDLKDGQGKVVRAGSKEIALFRKGGTFYATTNACLHQGGPLGEGELDGTTVTCPLHAWQYDVASGACLTVPSARLQTFAVQVSEQDVLVDV